MKQTETSTEVPTESVANSEESLLADGGIDYSEYDIDPAGLNYEKEIGWHNNQNCFGNYMCRVEGTDLWVYYTSTKTGRNEFSRPISGIGRLSIVPVELDEEFIAEHIRDIAEEMSGDEVSVELAEWLDSHASDLAERLVNEWESAVPEVFDTGLADSSLPHNKKFAWAVADEPYRYEVEDVLRDADFEDEEGAVHDALCRALSGTVSQHDQHWLTNGNAEYIARLRFESEPWEVRALELYQNSVFHRDMETARVQALSETGADTSEIASELGLTSKEVSTQKERADEWLNRAEWSANNCPS